MSTTLPWLTTLHPVWLRDPSLADEESLAVFREVELAMNAITPVEPSLSSSQR